MELGNAFVVVRQHVGAVILVLLLGVVAASTLTARVNADPEYRASAVVLIVSSPQTAASGGAVVNPLARLGTSERVVADVLARSMTTRTQVLQLQKAGVPGSYDIGTDPPSQGPQVSAPVLNVVTIAETAEEAVRGAEGVVSALQAELARRQAAVGAPRETWMQAQVLIPPDRARAVRGNAARVAAGVLGLTVAAAVSVAFLLEGAVLSRRQRVRTAEATATGQVLVESDNGSSPPARVPEQRR